MLIRQACCHIMSSQYLQWNEILLSYEEYIFAVVHCSGQLRVLRHGGGMGGQTISDWSRIQDGGCKKVKQVWL